MKTPSLSTEQVYALRKDFPILHQEIYPGKPLVYFDNAATSQKPQRVIDRITEVYRSYNSNIHRGVHALSDKASEEYEQAREVVRQFIGAEKKEEIIFTHGTTSAINALAFSFGEKYVKEGDEILISTLEHHSNIVPWQMLCERKKAILKVIPVNDQGEILQEEYQKLLSGKTRLLALTQVSNAIGTVNPVKEMIRLAHEKNIPVLIDGAQSIQHGKVDMQELDCDFFVFSGHKVYGPTGIGVLYGKERWLDDLPPYQGGGDMVERVSFEKTSYNVLPFKFEAGTANYVGAIGMAEGLKYLEETGKEAVQQYENELLEYATAKLLELDEVRLIGTAEDKIAVLSFLLKDIHQYDAGMILDKLGIAVRTGTHCAEPAMKRFGIDGTIRASLCFYNTREEVDVMVAGLKKVVQMFS